MSGLSTALAAAAALAAATLAFTATSGSAAAPTQANCFLANEWRGWKSPSPNVIYLRVGGSEVWRLELSAGSSQLQAPGVHLVSQVRGSDWVCSPLDLDLTLADDSGSMREPLFVKSIAQLSPQEAEAIPRQFQP
jgi:hypothetical protein